jgi:hypothetical protein
LGVTSACGNPSRKITIVLGGKPQSVASKKDQLKRISPGFYSDRGGALYVDMAEFLAAHGVQDTIEARSEAWREIHHSMGPVEITEISD